MHRRGSHGISQLQPILKLEIPAFLNEGDNFSSAVKLVFLTHNQWLSVYLLDFAIRLCLPLIGHIYVNNNGSGKIGISYYSWLYQAVNQLI